MPLVTFPAPFVRYRHQLISDTTGSTAVSRLLQAFWESYSAG